MISSISPGRRDRIQVVRGVCIFAVVLIHSLPVGLIQVFVRPFLNFAVACFLFLSGMLSDPDRWNPGKRIKKVSIPYIIWTLVYTVMTKLHALQAVPITYLKNLLTGRAAAIMYYVFVYCELTLLIPVFDRLARSRYRFFVFLISPLEIVLFRLLPLLGVYSLPHYVTILRGVSCLGYISFFYLGFLIGNGYLSGNYSKKSIAIAVCASILIQIAEGFWYFQIDQTESGTAMKLSAMLTSILCCLLLYCYIRNENAGSIQFLKLLGDYSFGIFFCHIAVLKVLKHLPFYSLYLRFPINGLVTVALSLLIVFVGRKLLGKHAKYVAF